MFYDPKGPHGMKHNPFKSLVVPRPIGWISSQDRNGVINLAPFSFFNAMSATPPIVVIGCNGRHTEGGVKDTLTNIEQTGEFVCNVVTFDLREAMNATSANAPRNVDEFELAGLTKIPSNVVKPPRVAESPVHLECKLIQVVPLPADDPEQPNNAIFGQVVGIHIDESIITDGMVDMDKFKPLARLGYMDYSVVDNVFALDRPK